MNTQDNHLLKPKNSLKDTVYTIPNMENLRIWIVQYMPWKAMKTPSLLYRPRLQQRLWTPASKEYHFAACACCYLISLYFHLFVLFQWKCSNLPGRFGCVRGWTFRPTKLHDDSRCSASWMTQVSVQSKLKPINHLHGVIGSRVGSSVTNTQESCAHTQIACIRCAHIYVTFMHVIWNKHVP